MWFVIPTTVWRRQPRPDARKEVMLQITPTGHLRPGGKTQHFLDRHNLWGQYLAENAQGKR